jgi:hypothetical protein
MRLVRLKITETPVFARAPARDDTVRLPFTEAYGGMGMGCLPAACAPLSSLCVLALRGTRDVVIDGGAAPEVAPAPA